PLSLFAAMLPGDLVHSPLQRLSQPKIVTVQRQYLVMPNRVKNPVRQLDLNLLHSTIPSFSNNAGTLDQPESLEDFLTTRRNVGADPDPRQPFKCRLQGFVPLTIRHAIGHL